jgi:hypothetical protein
MLVNKIIPSEMDNPVMSQPQTITETYRNIYNKYGE